VFAAEFWSKSVVGKIRARSRESTSGLAVDVGPEVGSRLRALADVGDVGPKVGSRLSAWLWQMSGRKSGVDFRL